MIILRPRFLSLLLALSSVSAWAQTTLTSVSPLSADPGDTNVLVTFTLPDGTPPTPPEQVNPTSATIGSITGTSLTRVDFTTVTAQFTFPAAETEGVKTATVTFITPGGTIAMTGSFTVGSAVTDNGPPSSGYNLFSPLGSTDTTLLDNNHNVINTWTSSYGPGLSMYLMDNGDLIRTASTTTTDFDTGGAAGRIERYDWDGNLVWEFDYDTAAYRSHHDIEVLPNGNILLIAWQLKTEAEAIAVGRDPSLISEGELWPDSILEIEPTGSSGGNIVWEWHVWDHLIQDYDASKPNYGVVADHPEKIDINYMANTKADWNHINSIDYHEDLDQIVVSVRSFSEVWVIDHDTTTVEASGSAGDLLFRWGNPAAHGDAGDQVLFVQHDATWIESGLEGEGNLLIFNNGTGRDDGDYSSIEEVTLPLLVDETYDWDTAPTLVWNYTAETPTDFYASRISGAQRLRNGNTLICEGTEFYAFEVNTDGDLVWEYTDSAELFRFERYAPDFTGFRETELALPTVTYPIVDTAQDTFFDNDDEISEPTAMDDFYGQDAHVAGHTPTYDISPDGKTVYDYNTRLTWTQSPDWDGDGDIDVDDKMNQAEAAAYVATLNTANFGGYNDWRLPSIKEVYSLMDFRGTDPMSDDTSTLTPFINSDYFAFAWGDLDANERTVDSQVATTSIHLDTIMSGPEAMSGLNIVDGRIKAYPTSKNFLVYLCRGNTSYAVNSFTDNGDDTVTDYATGLMWMKNDNGSGELWKDALDYVQTQNAANFLGYNDWRLPNAKEMQSLVDYSRAPTTTDSPAIDPVFTCTEIVNEGGVKDWPWYVTSTTHIRQDGTGSSAIYVCFGRATGYVNDIWDDVHGSGAQRSDPKVRSLTGYSYVDDGYYFTQSPQGDASRWSNYIRLVRDAPDGIPAMVVSGNEVVIENGDTTPSRDDYTDLGELSITSNGLSEAFTITNNGNGELVIDSIQLSGEHTGDFSLMLDYLQTTLAPGESSDFYVDFFPTFLGQRNATVDIVSNDPDTPFTMDITGTGTLEILYVHAGSDTDPADQNGASWSTAFKDLQDALALATSGHEIHVSGGTYYPDEAAAGHATVTDDDRSSTFTIPPGVQLYGGYSSASGVRNVSNNYSSLMGDLDQDDTIGEGYVDSDPSNNTKNNNSYSVVTVTESDSSDPSLLDGFIITAGRANGSSPHSTKNGAGLYVSDGNGFSVANCTFIGNYAKTSGGALYWSDSGKRTISNCRFEANDAFDSGAAVYLDISSLEFTDCEFTENMASGGGAVWVEEATATFIRSVFQANSAEGGGGIYVDTLGEATVRNCLFTGNYVIEGGAVVSRGTFTGESSTFASNLADWYGGGILAYSGAVVTLNNCIVSGNEDFGGLDSLTANIRNVSATVTISNSCIPNSGGSDAWVSSLGTDGGGNLGVSPNFEDPESSDDAPTTNGDYTLGLEDSPAINAGANDVSMDGETDLIGTTRVLNQRVDMGAYESDGDRTPTADADGDELGDWDELIVYGTDPSLSDSDDDGMNDGDEITAGTDPIDDTSILQPTVTLLDNGNYSVSWDQVADRVYVLYSKEKLTDEIWTLEGVYLNSEGPNSVSVTPREDQTQSFSESK